VGLILVTLPCSINVKRLLLCIFCLAPFAPLNGGEIELNPVIDGAELQIAYDGAAMEMRWWGGGRLEESTDGSIWNVVATKSPFRVPHSDKSLYRVRDHWEGNRSITVNVPQSYRGDKAFPLFLLLHGFSQGADSFESYFKMKPLVDSYDFILVNPEGTRNSLGLPFWNAFGECCDIERSGVDDSSYLRGVIEAVRKKLNIDDRRVYVLGHSNGGFMAYQMACEHSDIIAGIVSFAGGSISDKSSCVPAGPVSVLHVHGIVDPIVPYVGLSEPFGVPFDGALNSVETWAEHNGVGPLTSDVFASLNLVALDFGNDTLRIRSPGNKHGDVELWSILNGSHIPLLSYNSDGTSTRLAEIAVEWLLRRSKFD